MTETAPSEQAWDSDAGQPARTPATHIDHGNDVPTMPLSQGASQNEADRPRVPRIALLADSFLEVNGLALTCRQLHDFAYRQRFPFLTLLAGPNTEFREAGTTCLAQLGLHRCRSTVGLFSTPFSGATIGASNRHWKIFVPTWFISRRSATVAFSARSSPNGWAFRRSPPGIRTYMSSAP